MKPSDWLPVRAKKIARLIQLFCDAVGGNRQPTCADQVSCEVGNSYLLRGKGQAVLTMIL